MLKIVGAGVLVLLAVASTMILMKSAARTSQSDRRGERQQT